MTKYTKADIDKVLITEQQALVKYGDDHFYEGAFWEVAKSHGFDQDGEVENTYQDTDNQLWWYRANKADIWLIDNFLDDDVCLRYIPEIGLVVKLYSEE